MQQESYNTSTSDEIADNHAWNAPLVPTDSKREATANEPLFHWLIIHVKLLLFHVFILRRCTC